MKIEVKNIQIAEFASEETLCFTADVFVDGKKAGYAKNNGTGGCTHIMPYPDMRELLSKAEAYASTLPPINYPDSEGMKGFSMPMDLENLVDDAVTKKDVEKQTAKIKKKIANDCNKGICYGKGDGLEGYRIVSWKGRKLAEVLSNPNGQVAVRKAVADIVSKLEPGEKILNSNIPVNLLT